MTRTRPWVQYSVSETRKERKGTRFLQRGTRNDEPQPRLSYVREGTNGVGHSVTQRGVQVT